MPEIEEVKVNTQGNLNINTELSVQTNQSTFHKTYNSVIFYIPLNYSHSLSNQIFSTVPIITGKFVPEIVPFYGNNLESMSEKFVTFL